MAELIALDIETTGLDFTRDRILSAALYASESECVAFSGEETAVIGSVDEWLRARRPGIVVGWHSSAFDCPMLRSRADHNRQPLLLELRKQYPLPCPELSCADRPALIHGAAPEATEASARVATAGQPVRVEGGASYLASFGHHQHLDIAPFWRPWARLRGLSGALKSVAKANGIPVIEVDRTRMAQLSTEELCRYNLSDVRATHRLARMLPEQWLDACPAPR